MRLSGISGVAWVVLSFSGVCRAADLPDVAPARDTAPAGNLPDLVRLKNGGMVRGAIIELLPGDHVLIQLPDGTQRRFESSEVEYAGAAGGAAAAQRDEPSPAPAEAKPRRVPESEGDHRRVVARVHSELSPVHLTANGSDVTFHVRTGTAQASVSGGSWSGRGGGGFWGGTVQAESYEQLCTAPCSVDLEDGPHKLALSRGDGHQVAADELVTVGGPSTINGEYTSYDGVRGVGWFLAVGGFVLVAASPFVAKNDCNLADSGCQIYDTGLMFGMLGGGAALGVVGVLLAFKSDEASVTLKPGVEAVRGARSFAKLDGPRSPTPWGLTGAVRF